MITKGPPTKGGLARVAFALPTTIWAERVNLVGEFNDWDTQATPMSQNHPGADWQVSVELKAGRRYRFRYLVNGKEWLNDWQADDYLENPYGGYDSVVDLAEVGVSLLPERDAVHGP